MSKSDDRRREEKERLWNEVMGKNRTYESTEASQEITLIIDEREKQKAKVQEKERDTKDILKSADKAMDELNRILQKQKKDLDVLANEMKKTSETTIDPSLMDLDRLEADLRRDYGTPVIKEEKPKAKNLDTEKIFDEVYNAVTSKIMGQKDAIRQMIIAFRRPYVMGEEAG